MANIVDFKCPNCNGPIKFNPSIGGFKCEFCGGVFEKEELSGKNTTLSKEDVLLEGNEDQKEVDESLLFGASKAEDSGNWDKSGIADWKDDIDKIKVYNCPSCGAGLICDKNTVANSCPYCDNPTISEGDISGALKPDYIIPFEITPEEAKAALKKHYEGKFLLPKHFKDENVLKEIKGIYVPFWLFDGESSGAASYDCTIRNSYRTGNKTIIKTSHFKAQRSGDVAFKRVPTDAAKKMPDDIMDSVEPFDYGKMVPFEMSYLSGFFADKYDVTIDENANRADNRCKNTVREILRDTVKGYTTVHENNFSASIRRGQVRYAMLPVYMLRTKWRDQEYIFSVNGQTGKAVGNLPSDPKRTFAGFMIGWGIGFAIAAAVIGILLAMGD